MAILLKPDEILITDCAQYKVKEVREGINDLRKENPDNKGLAKRSNFSYLNEWAVHALCFRWNIKPDHTKDADLQFDLKCIYRFLYNLLGPIARLFLKFYR